MKHLFFKFASVSALLLAGCTSSSIEDESENNSSNTSTIEVNVRSTDWVTTRSVSKPAQSDYPIYYYLINRADSTCIDLYCQESMADANAKFSVPLGNYSLYATSGIESNVAKKGNKFNYDAVLVEKMINKSIQIGQNDFTVNRYNSSNVIDVVLKPFASRFYLKIDSVPATVSRIMVQLSPLYYKYKLNGSYVKVDSTRTVYAFRTEEGYWQVPFTYMYPCSNADSMLLKMYVTDENRKLLLRNKSDFTLKAGVELSLKTVITTYSEVEGGTHVTDWETESGTIEFSSCDTENESGSGSSETGGTTSGGTNTQPGGDTDPDKDNGNGEGKDDPEKTESGQSDNPSGTITVTYAQGQKFEDTSAYILSVGEVANDSVELVLFDADVIIGELDNKNTLLNNRKIKGVQTSIITEDQFDQIVVFYNDEASFVKVINQDKGQYYAVGNKYFKHFGDTKHVNLISSKFIVIPVATVKVPVK